MARTPVSSGARCRSRSSGFGGSAVSGKRRVASELAQAVDRMAEPVEDAAEQAVADIDTEASGRAAARVAPG